MLADAPFVDEPHNEEAVGGYLVYPVPRGGEGKEEFDDAEEQVDGEEYVPHAFAAVEVEVRVYPAA